MIFDADGKKRRHEFQRARDEERRQALVSGSPGRHRRQRQREVAPADGPRPASLLAGLRRALRAPATSAARSTSICPERKILLDARRPRRPRRRPERLDAHRLIEEFMIQANVAAAETLEQAKHAARLSRPRRALEGEDQEPARLPRDARSPAGASAPA